MKGGDNSEGKEQLERKGEGPAHLRRTGVCLPSRSKSWQWHTY